MIIDVNKNSVEFYASVMPPDPFVDEKKKYKPAYIKTALDFYANLGYTHCISSKDVVKNYRLLKGVLTREDFYETEETKSWIEQLTKDVALPAEIQHYSIMNPVINTLVGEMSRRPDQTRIKAMDEDSKAEELEFRKEIINNAVMQNAKRKLLMKAAMQGVEIPEDELQEMTMKDIEQELVSYTSKAEKWANKVLNSCKLEFNVKELSEEAFRDLNTCNSEYYHVYEDNSKTGMSLEVLNKKNVANLTTENKKYTSDVSGMNKGAFASVIVRVMEISEIIDRFNLPKDEVDHLRKQNSQTPGFPNTRSNFNSNETGPNTIKYDTYDPVLLQQQLLAEAEMMKEGNPQDDISGLIGRYPQIGTYGSRFVVVESYFLGKKEVGQITFVNEQGDLETKLVDRSYEKIPNEVDAQWNYVNQWYKGLKVGTEIYHLEEFNFLPYNPVIGVSHEIKNAPSRSLVDLMKPFQIIYNVCMNQLFALLGKEKGVVLNVPLRRIPRAKDGDGQDDIDIWEQEAIDRGIIFEDDSPENAKVAGSTQTIRAVDLSRGQEMQMRYNIAVMLKQECWELVGISRQRTGGVLATETATGTNTALSQSYAQTEPIFAQHEYVLNQVYQALVDGAQYLELKKPGTTLSLINSEGDREFLTANGEDLSMRDLKVFVTSRAQDMNTFNKMQQLADTMLQNGATPYEISVLFSTNSVRMMQDTFKRFQDKRDAMMAQQNQIEQQKIQQAQEAVQAQIQAQQQQHVQDQAWESNENALDRLARREEAIIKAMGFGKVQGEDADGNGIQDALEIDKLSAEKDKITKEQQMQMQELLAKTQADMQKLQIEREKMQVARENMKNDKEIAQINLKGRQKANKSKK